MRLEVELAPELGAYVRNRTAEGRHASVSEFVEECVELHRITEVRRQEKVRALRRAVREGIRSLTPGSAGAGGDEPPADGGRVLLELIAELEGRR